MVEYHHAWTIGRTDLRRRWRSLRGNVAQLGALAFAAFFFVPLSVLGLYGAYGAGVVLGGGELFGESLAPGDLDVVVRYARLAAGGLWLGVAGFGAMRAYQTALRPDCLDGHLTTVSHRELLAGLAISEVLTWALLLGAYGTLAALAFALGSGSVAGAVLVPLAGVLALATALAAGFVVALLVRVAGTRSVLLRRLRTALFAVLGIAYFGAIVTQSFDSALGPVVNALAASPVGWLGDLAMLGSVSGASATRALGAVVGSTLVLPASAAALSSLAASLWYGDTARAGDDGEEGHEVAPASPAATDSRFGGSLPAAVHGALPASVRGVVPPSTLGVARVDWLRGRRAPATKAYLLYPLLIMMQPLTALVQDGVVPGSLPLLAVLSLSWIAGAAYALNVLGNEGAGLPAALLGASPGRSLVGGHVLAGAVLGVPLALLGAVGFGLAASLPLALVATLAVTALTLATAAGPIASGIGVALPRFEAVSVSRSTRAIVPSMLAFLVYSVAVLVVAAPALVAHSAVVGHALSEWVGVSRPVVAAIGTLGTAVLAVGIGLPSATYAVRTVDGYRLD